MKPSFFRFPISLLSASLFVAALLLSSRTTEAAPVVITKTGYTVTYPDGWMSPGIPTGDSAYFLMSMTLSSAVVFGHGLAMAPGVDQSFYIHAFTSAYTTTFARTDSSNKTLGANTFATSSYRDTAANSDTTSRIHIFVTSKNGFLFVSWLTCVSSEETAAVAQEETALATLNITAVAGIRSTTFRIAPVLPRVGFDIQGRSWELGENRIPRVAIFRK